MRVAWVTPHCPRPTGGGGAAHEFELLRHAARHHDIHLITSDLPPGRARFDLGERTITAEGVAWDSRRGPRNSAEFAACVGLHWPTVQARGQQDRVRSLAAALVRHLKGKEIDLVHLTFGEIAPVAQAVPVPVALLLLDVLSRQMYREGELARSRRGRLTCTIEARKIALWERRWFSRVDGVACVSSVDGEILRAALQRDVRVVPNPVSADFFAPPAVPRSDSTVVLVANLGYRPNVDAVKWLVGEIWPLVTRRRPDARLVVVGHEPVREVIDAVASVDGELHADVKDVRPFYWRAAVAVAPIRLGSGVRNKVLHAMACRAPVVATQTGVEGIDVRDGEQLLVAGDSPGLADAVVRVLDDPGAARVRADRALAHVQEYRTDQVMERFSGWWEEVASLPAGRPGVPAPGVLRASAQRR